MWKIIKDILALFIKKINKSIGVAPSEILDEAQEKIIIVWESFDRKKAFGRLYFKGHIMPVVSGGNDIKNKGFLPIGEYNCYKFLEDSRPEFSYRFNSGFKGFQVPIEVRHLGRDKISIHFDGGVPDVTAGCPAIRNELISPDAAIRYFNLFKHHFEMHTLTKMEVRSV